MLQAIRSRAAGIVVKVLFSILVISFAVWGIGDYAFLRQGDTTALKIGDVKMSSAALQQEYSSEVNRLRRTLGQFDADMARQFGLMDQVIQRIVTDTLIEKAADGLGIRIGDDVVRTRIMSAPELQSPGGGFDRTRFQQFLYESGLSEAGFLTQFRGELARGVLADAISAGIRPPAPLVERVYRYRNEKRAGESIFVAASSFGDVGKPDDAQLQSIYDDNRERFTAPEYRELTVARIGADELLKLVTPDDRQIEDEFRARLPELRTPERRDVEQLLFADEDVAKTASGKLTGGTSFADVAKEAGMPADQTRLGSMVRDDLTGDLADAVFALPLNGISAPLRSPFGWHIFRVTKIEPGREPSFAETKDRIAAELQRRLAGESAYEAATRVEDALAGGSKLEEAAAKAGVTAIRVPAVDLRGRTPSGQAVAALDGASDVLSAAFETAAGRETQLIEGRENTWFVVRVDGVTPSALRPLAEVRDDVIALWQAEKREEAAKARAEQILAAVTAGRTLEAASSAFGLKAAAIPPVVRNLGFDTRNTAVAPEVNARLFTMKVGEVAVVPGRDGVHVAKLTQIVPADPAADQAGLDQLRALLQQQLRSDLIGEYAEALRQRFGVTVYRDIIDKML